MNIVISMIAMIGSALVFIMAIYAHARLKRTVRNSESPVFLVLKNIAFFSFVGAVAAFILWGKFKLEADDAVDSSYYDGFIVDEDVSSDKESKSKPKKFESYEYLSGGSIEVMPLYCPTCKSGEKFEIIETVNSGYGRHAVATCTNCGSVFRGSYNDKDDVEITEDDFICPEVECGDYWRAIAEEPFTLMGDEEYESLISEEGYREIKHILEDGKCPGCGEKTDWYTDYLPIFEPYDQISLKDYVSHEYCSKCGERIRSVTTGTDTFFEYSEEFDNEPEESLDIEIN